MDIKITKARKSDVHEILRLIDELAEFEKLTPPDEKAKKHLVNDAFGKKPAYHVILAKIDRKTIGYAFYFYTYSSFLARKTLYLEDIYISIEYRRLGTGKLLFNKLIDIARKKGCGRMEWCVLEWNKNAIDFYEKLGAKELKEWKYYRLSLE
ncbi:MAG: GNAT family N-acetyltransferase [Ignavibacteria bacterium]|jgi:GNAT superfamily N-acetyltransferase